MRQKKHAVVLDKDERDFLKTFTSTGIPSSRQRIAACILLITDNTRKDQPLSNQAIAATLNVNPRTVIRTKRHYIQRGLHATIMGTYSTARLSRHALDGQQKARLIELVRSPAPLGVQRWTLRLLAERMIQRGYVDQLSHETVRKTLLALASQQGPADTALRRYQEPVPTFVRTVRPSEIHVGCPQKRAALPRFHCYTDVLHRLHLLESGLPKQSSQSARHSATLALKEIPCMKEGIKHLIVEVRQGGTAALNHNSRLCNPDDPSRPF